MELARCLFLKRAWSEDVGAYMREHGIYALRLTDYYGFKGYDLSFLSELTFLRSLELYCWEAKGVKIIETLPQLEVIGLQYKSTQKVDLSAFKNLKVGTGKLVKRVGFTT